ncbi:MAG: DUF3089 domain-containing protein [Alphaproteobacteria bacterium]|nr:DUF3089 domain-containing protein [Alphaproteobacteria bacterium]MBU2379607.1 DUF3089 domain-containing protein [Alphaproteobacteria bacterium]
MTRPRLSLRQWAGWTGFALVFIILAAFAVWRGDILKAGLDPQIPFQAYDPPAAPDYDAASAWVMRDTRVDGAGSAAIFFLHSTTFDGGSDWNGPIGDPQADAYLQRVVVPNYAGPFARAGAISLPRYRQGSLYTRLTLRDDARDARAFAYGDALAAFDAWLAGHPTGPLVLAGVEQGGELIDRLVRERVAGDASLRARIVAVYLIDVIVAADNLSPLVPACVTATSTGCVIGWSQVDEDNEGAARRRLRRALVWNAQGRLVDLDGRPALCVNPVSGARNDTIVPARQHHGAANATGLEWGVRPAFIDRAVATRCVDGILRHTELKTESFREVGGWADRRKARQYNLFYADIEADVERRLNVWTASNAS